jgi:hypothetical protein
LCTRSIHQAAARAVPFGQHQHALGRHRIDGLGELGPVAQVFARGLFAEDLVAAFSAQRRDLSIEARTPALI